MTTADMVARSFIHSTNKWDGLVPGKSAKGYGQWRGNPFLAKCFKKIRAFVFEITTQQDSYLTPPQKTQDSGEQCMLILPHGGRIRRSPLFVVQCRPTSMEKNSWMDGDPSSTTHHNSRSLHLLPWPWMFPQPEENNTNYMARNNLENLELKERLNFQE
ncbi:hypothetical protein VNO77_05064 [Canavalia gladiata]|uniref:Uncharacterized protein n=1 Tax=Canavalia gladiata TaxID=3824 RepID=A0AAN9MXN0_CANGL